MQTLRKKTSPCKYKNEPSRYLGEGACFRAKLIGVLEVSEARGDRMCQDALADLKMAIRAAGEHKQRITVHVAIDGLRLRDDKTGDSLYHHPVHKISFIAQDMTDSRAFGYVFGSPDTGHRFFGIKTDKAASQVVIAMRDLFQVVFELKKKEIELAKQHISEQKSRYGSSNLFSDSSTLPSVKSSAESSTKTSAASVTSEPNKSGAIADLVDLELELSSIQQGIHQMERITPSTDPFGDSFTSFPKPILPPPPRSGRVLSPPRRRQQQQPNTTTPSTSSAREVSLFDSPTSDTGMQEDDWFSPPITKSTSPLPMAEAEEIKPSSESDKVSLSYKSTEEIQKSILDQFDVFTDLDPLGTGRSKPYVDKKLFFHELKNPPKKVLKDLVTGTSTTSLPQQSEPPLFKANFKQSSSLDPFADEDPFEKSDPFGSNIGDLKPLDPFNTDFVIDFKMYEQSHSKSAESETAQFKFPPVETLLSGEPESLDSSSLFDSSRSFDVQFASLKLSPKRSVSPRQESAQVRIDSTSLDLSSGSDGAPEPPPRPPVGAPALIKPPPLPPKKQVSDSVIARPPPRPPHYDYLEGTDSPPLPMPTRKLKPHSVEIARQQSEDDYLMPVRGESPLTTGLLLPPPRRKKPEDNARLNEITKNLTEDADFGKFDDFDKATEKSTVEVSSQLPKVSEVTEHNDQKPDEESTLDSITLTDLTMGKFEDLAKKLNVPESKLRDMTLSQLTNLLRRVKQTTPTQSKSVTELKSEFSTNFTDVTKSESSFDKYAVFRELLETEIKKEPPKVEENDPFEDEIPVKDTTPVDSKIDRYAALRDILSEDLKKDEEVVSEIKNEIIEDIEDEIEVKTIEEPEEITHHIEEKPEKIEISIPIKESIIENPKEEKIAEVITPENKMAPIATSGSEGGVSISSPEEIKPPGEDGGGWAIFEGGEANSPWSSDSKEFVTASPMDRKPRRDQGNEEWWPDSYDDDEGWDYRLDAHGATAGRRGPVRYRECRHSSSSRDASPWEDEPRDLWSRRAPPPRRPYCRSRDSWDEEEEDYVYEHRRHPGSRERRREESWSVEGTRRHGPPRRRHRSDMDHHCCGEWEHERDTAVRRQNRYSERDRYAVPRSIDNEEYNCPVDSQHVSRQRGYKQRPASASEADRRCGVSTGPRRARSRGEPPHPMVPSSSSASQPPVHRHRQIKQARANPPPRPTFEDDFSEQSPLDTPSPKNKFEFLPEEIPKETRTLGRKRPERCRPEKDFATMSRQRNVFKYDFSEEFKPKTEPPVQQMVAEKEYVSTPVRQESQFEDDFSPPPQSKASTTQTSTIEAAENEDAVIQNAVPVRNNNIGRQNNHKAMKRLSACGRIDLNIKKSESINIFARESDPFEDDDFFTKDGDSDISTPGTKNGENGVTPVKGREGWTEDFGCFDTVEEEK